MEFKHFSHPHSLSFHQAPQSPETHCSGCNSLVPPGTSFYSCWQFKFFLHEQCFHASRSMKHNAHPPHPLTLVPYPTYSSSSFFCDSCSLTGTGFSYSCSSCDFDLHVHCAYMPQTTTHIHTRVFLTNYYSFPQETPNTLGPQFDYKLRSSTTRDPYDVNANFRKFNAQMGFSDEEVSSVANNKPTNSPYDGENRTVTESVAHSK